MKKLKPFNQFIKEEVTPIAPANNLLKEKEVGVSTFLLCPPYNLSNDVANNIWIKELPEKEKKIDVKKALRQWMDLYNFLAASSIVYLIPPAPGLQDQSYVANLGIVLPHRKEHDVIISNFTSEPRVNEAYEGIDFFKKLGYNVHQAPDKFEGEADLKFIKDNIYVGGYGIRSSKKTYDWMEKEFDMKIIPVEMKSEYLYHFDCMFFPVNIDNVIACTKLMDKASIRQLEKYADIHDVEEDVCESGITNSVVSFGTVCTHSNIDKLKTSDENYSYERKKVDKMNEICETIGMEPVYFDISEFTKSGALMSCLVMHLSFTDFKYPLV